MSETLAVLDGNETARKRLLSIRGEPLFYADWDNVIFIHYQTDPQELQRCIPYHLDLYDGSAFVSLVAFTMRGMRPRFGGSLSALFFKPISTHHFLNVRTYVTHQAEAGIYFMQRMAFEPAGNVAGSLQLRIAISIRANGLPPQSRA